MCVMHFRERRELKAAPILQVLRSKTKNEVSKENLNVQKWKADGVPRVDIFLIGIIYL